jgi:flagellar biosynthesis/type III secretory pathway M-ring protein FliF/YscJ
MGNNGILNGWKEKVDNIGFVRQVREINKKYATPKVKMTPMVKYALLFLRIYLIVLVLLLGFKFFTIIHGGSIGGSP